MYRTLALAQEQKKQTMNLRSERIYVSGLPFNYCACHESYPHKTPNMVQLEQPRMLFSVSGTTTTPPITIRSTKFGRQNILYLLTLPWTTVFATTQKRKIVLYKLTLYLPSNSRKKNQ
jgi:hypothetical protein